MASGKAEFTLGFRGVWANVIGQCYGPMLWAGGAALLQLWVFLLAPLAGGALAGLLHGLGFTRAKP